MSTIDGSTHIEIRQSIPRYEGFDLIAYDFSTEIDLAAENFKNLLCYAQEQQEEITRLNKALEIAKEKFALIDASFGDSWLIEKYSKEAQKQIKEIMESK